MSKNLIKRSGLWPVWWMNSVAVALASACSSPSPVDVLNSVIPSSGYDLQSDIPYGTWPRQTMDIYTPTTPADLSRTIIFVYGGAWREGKKDDYEFVGHALANAGHTVVIPDYRLYPEVQFPDFVLDVANAIGVLASNDAAEYSIAGEEIVLMGHSSGAHTAALLVSDPQYLEDVPTTISALIGLSGPYDLPIDNPEVAPVFNTADNMRPTNPVKLVNASHPPVLLIHGVDDERVLPFHAENYANALNQVQIPVALHLLSGEDHKSIVAGIAAPLDIINKTSELITSYLAKNDDANE